jgi:hypothetical protein
MASNKVEGVLLNPKIFFDRLLSNKDPSIFNNFPDIGKWLDHVYTLEFRKESYEETMFLDSIKNLDCFGLVKRIPAGQRFVEPASIPPPRSLEILKADTELAFSVKFVLFVLLSHNRITEYSITSEVLELLKKYPEGVAEAALESLFSHTNRSRIWDFAEKLKIKVSNW